MHEPPDPTFSIVTASCRQLPWLRLCVTSVADQTGITCQHIVQDGGSGPGLEELARLHPEVQFYQEADGGMYDALNRGLKRTQGQLLGWLNSDEQYLSGTLQRVERFFDEHQDVQIVFGDAILVDLEGRALSYRRVVRPNRMHTRLEHLGTLSCATFFRRSLLDQGLFFDTQWRSIGDCVWVDSLLERGIPMATLPEPLATYTFTGANLSASERGDREMQEWSRQADAPARWLWCVAVLWHRLRKMAAGAYRRRHLRYSIYTMVSPHRRVPFDIPRVGFGWPGDTAPPAPGCEKPGPSKRLGDSA